MSEKSQDLPTGDELPEEFHDDETRALVERAQGGDVDALNDLFQRYHQTMVEVARRKLGPRLRMKEDPDDLAQTTFREATRDFSQYRYQGEGSLLRWLMQILKNKIRDRAEFYTAGKRDFSRERAIEAPDDDGAAARTPFDFASHDLSVTQAVQRDENFEILREALKDLSDEHRQAITLVFFQGCSIILSQSGPSHRAPNDSEKADVRHADTSSPVHSDMSERPANRGMPSSISCLTSARG